MCGICGVLSTNLTAKEVTVFKDLLLMNQWRGTDSTGIMSFSDPNHKTLKRIRNGEPFPVRVFKEAVDAWSFLDLKQVDKTLSAYSPNKLGFVGHTRAATVGEVSTLNAHPFVFPNTIGIVNGTVSKSQIPGEEAYETDAEAMIALIDEQGEEAALPQLISLPSAPFALVYFNRRDNTLNFLRSETNNNTRPLAFIYSEDKKTLLFSSEFTMIDWVTDRHIYKLFRQPTSYWHTKINYLMKIPLADGLFQNIAHKEIKPIPKKPAAVDWSRRSYPESSKRTDYVGGYRGFEPDKRDTFGRPKPATGMACDFPITDWNNFSSDDEADVLALPPPQKPAETSSWPVGGSSSRVRTKEEAADKKDKKDDDVGRHYLVPRGLYVSKASFTELCKSGCCVCRRPIDVDTPIIDTRIAWSKIQGARKGWEPICEECKDTDWVQDEFVNWSPTERTKQ